MRIFLLSLTMAIAGAQAAPQANQGVISGRVTRLGGSEAVAGVEVTLMGPYVGSAMNAVVSNPLMAAEIADAMSLPQMPATTDSNGRFKFTGLAPGVYTAISQRDGYFGSSTPGGAAISRIVTSVVTLVAGQTIPEIQISMVRGGMISGQVRDPNGQLAPGLTVATYQVTYRDGRAGLSPVISKTTDDRGEYRIFWLTPGEYYVAVSPPRPDTIARTQDRYAKTFHPQATDAQASSRLLVTDGAELVGTNIAIQNAAVKLSGEVISTLTGTTASATAAPTSNANFYLLPQDPNILAEFAITPFSNLNGSRGGGKFELRGVSPGLYDLIATMPDGRGRATPGRTRIAVGAQDLDNIKITIHPGVDVKVQVSLDGTPIPALVQTTSTGSTAAPLRPIIAGIGNSFTVVNGVTASAAAPNLRLALQPLEGIGFDFTAPVTVNGDSSGAFVFSNVPEARYTIQVTGLPANAFVADIRENGVSVYDSGFQVADQTPPPIELSIRSGGSTIRGIVRDANQNTVATARVVLVPQLSRRGNTALFKTVLSNRDGTFTLTSVPPGEYKLFAWYNVPPNASFNPEFLSKYDARGQTITVVPNTAVEQQLTAIPDEPAR